MFKTNLLTFHSLQHAKYFGSRGFVTQFAGSARAAPPDLRPGGQGMAGQHPAPISSHRRGTQPVFWQTPSIRDREHGANRHFGATRRAGSGAGAGTCWEVQDGFTRLVTKSSANNALAPFLLQNEDLEDICKISFNPYFQSFKKSTYSLAFSV